MNDEISILINDFISMDPIIMKYISYTLHSIDSNYQQFKWAENIDFADIFFSAYQDAIKVSSEKELDRLFSPAYYKVFYDDFLREKIITNAANIISSNQTSTEVFDSQIEELCKAAPKVAKLRPAICITSNFKEIADESKFNIDIPKYDKSYNDVINLAFYIMTSYGGAAQLFYTDKVSRHIEDSGGFNKFIIDSLKNGIEFDNKPDELFPKYMEYYYDIMKIDDDFLFRCAIVMYNNRRTLGEKTTTDKEIKTKKTLKDKLDTIANNVKKQEILPNKIESILLTKYISLNIKDPRVFIYGLHYVSILIDKYKEEWKLKLGR